MIDLQPFDGQQATDAEIDEYHEFRCTVYLVDYPDMPAPTRQAALSRLREPDPDLGEQRRWTVRLDGRLAAWAVVALLDEPRAHLAEVQIHVHPTCAAGASAPRSCGGWPRCCAGAPWSRGGT